ncbi:FtsW/RodA/SpoVE family cell cycle protein [Candidatus Uhrbacteria bacterium]|nr:FtsW/RodA/SpoVE family cell cycle protein [Candidatus Uhrbacteria bacterium]
MLRSLRHLDGLFLAAVALMAVLGCIGLASLGLRSDPPEFSAFTRQLIALGIGVILLFAFARIDWTAWERWWPMVAVVTVGLLVGVLLFGARIRGTRGWFVLGPWTLQPVEFAKIGLILLQAAYFRRRARLLTRWRTVLESAAITSAVVVPVLLQPDLGSALLLVATWFGMLLVFGLRRNHLLAIVVAALVLLVVGWQFFLQPYQRDRVLTVLDPNRDPQGAGYNQRQAVIAIGAGGVFGQGFGQGTQAQLRFLPEAQTDFLPAVLAEEFGFVGVVVLLGCLVVVLLRLLAIARRCPDDFSAAMVVGFGVLFGVQALLNLGMNLGVAPVMGIPFPFVSAGGSSVIALAAGVGIVMSVARRTPKAERRVYQFDIA